MEDLISASEAATLIGVSRVSIHNFAKAGRLPTAAIVGKKKALVFSKAAVLRFAEQYTKNGEAA